MRMLVVVTALLLPGCILEPGLEDSGKDCSSNDLDGPGFLVRVPETIGEGDNRIQTEGYCVSMHLRGEDTEKRRPVHEGSAWFSVSTAGTYQFSLYIQEPRDRYCAFALEAEAEHDGASVVRVELVYDGVSICS